MVLYFAASFPFYKFVCGLKRESGCSTQIVQRKYVTSISKTGKLIRVRKVI